MTDCCPNNNCYHSNDEIQHQFRVFPKNPISFLFPTRLVNDDLMRFRCHCRVGDHDDNLEKVRVDVKRNWHVFSNSQTVFVGMIGFVRVSDQLVSTKKGRHLDITKENSTPTKIFNHIKRCHCDESLKVSLENVNRKVQIPFQCHQRFSATCPISAICQGLTVRNYWRFCLNPW